MSTTRKFDYEIIFDLLSLALGGIIIIVSLGYGFGSLAQPGPGIYTCFIGLAILPLSVVILVSALRNKSKGPLFSEFGARRFILMTATFVLWIVGMPYLGYVIMTLISTYGFCKIMQLEGWVKPSALSIGTALFIYLLFDYWLYIDLPRGLFLG